jgi:signal transduction histidine kinase
MSWDYPERHYTEDWKNMAYNRFRLNCIIRVIVLGLTILGFFFILFQTSLYAALFIVGVIIIYQTYALIHYVEKTNRDLTRFFTSIRYSDFSQTFKDAGLGPSFDELRKAFTEVMNVFRKTRKEKEEHYQYLQTIVQHIGIGLIAYQPNGDVELINTAAKRLLGIPALKNIQSLETFSKPLVDTLFKIKPKGRALIKVEDQNEFLHLSLYATEFKLRGQVFSLVSIQNIHSELEEREIEAWQKLIRVITHEIMNSITPISSLASTINEMLKENYQINSKDKKFDSESLTDIHDAAQTIQKRSQGLLHFVDAYRNLTLIQKPNFQLFPVKELFGRVEKLMQANIKEKGIRLKIKVDPKTLELTADPELIEQVLINLLLNALQSVGGQKKARIDLISHLDGRGRILIQVMDNGPGIDEENLEKIFIPFFSTKDMGSGIGLSLSRQIMRLHHGSISVQSDPKKQTTFTLRF